MYKIATVDDHIYIQAIYVGGTYQIYLGAVVAVIVW